MIDFPFAPDWTEPVIERLEWLTEVIEARNGIEQRARLRTHPRRTVEWQLAAGYDPVRVRLENVLLAAQGAGCMAPVWTDFTRLDTAAAAGAASLSGATADRDFRPGDRFGLIGPDGAAEFGTIDTVTPSGATLVAPLVRAWPAGTKLVPLRAARLGDSLTVGYLSDAIGAATVQFRFEDEHAVSPAAEAADYRGYPVLLSRTEWSEDPTAEHSRRLEVFDSETGLIDERDALGFATVTRTHRWVLTSRAEQSAFRAWLFARAGRLNPFWLPSGQEDIRLVAGPSGTTVTLNVENRGHALIAAGDAYVGRRDIMIETHAGARYYRRVVNAIGVDPTTEQLVIDAPIGVALSLSDIRRISFMRLVRLASDAVELAHHTDELAVCQLSLASLRDA